MPFQWLERFTYRVRGAGLPSQHPGDPPPPWSIDWLKLPAAIALAFLLAELTDLAWRYLTRKLDTATARRPALRLAGVAVAGAVVGALVPTKPEWIGVMLGLVVLPLVILVATWHCRTYGSVAAACVISVVALRWGIWVRERIRPTFGPPHFDLREDVVAPVVLGLGFLVPLLAVTSVRRWIASRRAKRRAMSDTARE